MSTMVRSLERDFQRSVITQKIVRKSSYTLTAVFSILIFRTGPQQQNSRLTSFSEKPAGNGPANTAHISRRFAQTCPVKQSKL